MHNYPIIKTPQEIEKMRIVGQKVARTLSRLQKFIQVGMTTQEIDDEAAKLIQAEEAKSSFLGYEVQGRIYPAHICISLDEEVVHGIPGKRKIKKGQIISLDCGVNYKGWHGDSALSFALGKISQEKQKLLSVGYQALWAGIKSIKPGSKVSDISLAIETYVRNQGQYGIVEDFSGHGIGASLHEGPCIPNFLKKDKDRSKDNPDFLLRPGYTIAIEPMVNLGEKQVLIKSDGWTVSTIDNKPSVHFEHTIAITTDGYEVLTLRPEEIGALNV